MQMVKSAFACLVAVLVLLPQTTVAADLALSNEHVRIVFDGKGRLEVECRIEGEGFRLSLADRWFNPCDELAGAYSPFEVAVTPQNFGRGRWRKLVVTWDFDAPEHHEVIATADGEEIAHKWLDNWLEERIPPAGVSYLHLITLAEDEDTKGSYFRSFSVRP